MQPSNAHHETARPDVHDHSQIGPQSDRRGRILEMRRVSKMAGSTHAYVRGNTLRFYERLGKANQTVAVSDGPGVWICGDCHTGNIGPISERSGRIDIQIRYVDQTVLGNPAHDLLRLGLSCAMAGRSSDLPGVTTA